jgi:hypothetical protein
MGFEIRHPAAGSQIAFLNERGAIMNIGLALALVGLALIGFGSAFFRHSNVPMMFHGPIWHASKFLKPTGVKLWIVGQAVSTIGLVLWGWSYFA